MTWCGVFFVCFFGKGFVLRGGFVLGDRGGMWDDFVSSCGVLPAQYVNHLHFIISTISIIITAEFDASFQSNLCSLLLLFTLVLGNHSLKDVTSARVMTH